jgi:hypothetical protein
VGGGAAAAIRNAPRTMVAQSLAWMRCVLAWPWAEESKGEKQKRARCRGRLLLKWRRARQGRGGGPKCGTAWRREWGRERGGPDRWGTARAVRQRPSRGACRRRSVAMPRGRPNRGEERGLTCGLQPQCWVAALADRRARVAQYQAA